MWSCLTSSSCSFLRRLFTLYIWLFNKYSCLNNLASRVKITLFSFLACSIRSLKKRIIIIIVQKYGFGSGRKKGFRGTVKVAYLVMVSSKTFVIRSRYSDVVVYFALRFQGSSYGTYKTAAALTNFWIFTCFQASLSRELQHQFQHNVNVLLILQSEENFNYLDMYQQIGMEYKT